MGRRGGSHGGGGERENAFLRGGGRGGVAAMEKIPVGEKEVTMKGKGVRGPA